MSVARPVLCIIADDLTGALDAAAPFAGRGLSVRVALSPAALPDVLSAGADVVAVNTASREIPEDAAVARVAQVRAALPAGLRIFKKVDSRLKGHVAAELAALGPARLLVAPAIPVFGRIVQAGAVTGFGTQAPIPVAQALGDLADRALIPDTASAGDMQAALLAAPGDALPVGARGLAEALAIRLSGRTTLLPFRPRAARALLVIGSRDPITLAQVAALRARGGVDWRAAPDGALSDRAPCAALTLVQATDGGGQADGAAVAAALAAAVHPRLTRDARALFLSGGATAEAVLAAMGIGHLLLHGECLPGVPAATADGRIVLTKSGGFGTSDLLSDLARILAENS